ncbi:gluconate 5-dehydrogenase [mine drainage metagenome]|uniref:Gluconate 5-dehydrogenase n=1 Tax=mine drainage metagenome TaxID=410659 RepID=A0A1J5RTX2_9ZZZZ
MRQLQNKRAVITGGSDGIGFGIAKSFIENGADVLIIARSKKKLEDARCQLSAISDQKIHCISADLSNCSAVSETANRIATIWPDLDIIVNNAGSGIFSPFEDVTFDEFDALINLNVKAPYFLSQSLLPALVKRKGNIINISSYFSHRMIPGRTSTAYSLTKGAIDSFTKALAIELGVSGIRVNAIAPGTVDTQLVRNALEKMSVDSARKFKEMIETIYPLGRIGTPRDVGGAAVYLASDYAKWVTGAIFNIDGGLTTN